MYVSVSLLSLYEKSEPLIAYIWSIVFIMIAGEGVGEHLRVKSSSGCFSKEGVREDVKQFLMAHTA